ncbi:MAG TPA: hypothetical protein VGH38_26950 [Bryobacteraceae bacterium]
MDRLLSHIDPGTQRHPKTSYASSMISGILTVPPIPPAGLAVDTDLASFIFKWHPEFAASFVALLRGSELPVSFCSTWAAVLHESTRKGRRMGSADVWIAATALTLSVPLVTNNPKDYRHLDRLQLVSMVTA